MIQAIFFDLDGTLIDSERAFLRGDSVAAHAMGQPLPPAHFLPLLGASMQSEHDFLTALVGPAVEQYKDQVRAYVDAWFRTAPAIALPGVSKTLATLAQTYRLGVVTSSRLPHLQLALQQAGWTETFTWLFPYVDGPAKPDPAPYLQALAQAQLPADAVVAVEDTPLGVAAAQAAGLRAVQVVDLAQPAPAADARLNDFQALPAWLAANA
ncbi:HAD family hydrolase [Lacticaseibacillus nasuensis]|uniref:HAD family hydrolase n=1 Tax=Lacticaseibacillus nasuensis TaxID=944671 RepID=UPI0022487367|nr:HAD family phosphatase [Lacticaseibacillus nasuensis]MCX2454774.1 HAD family phosphatase [Lacticaseibacillus nasuensis]